MNKRLLTAVLLSLVLLGAGFMQATAASAETIRIGATPLPHAEILETLVPVLAEQGITLQVIEFTDYVRPNLALQDGDLDANYFQHQPYLDQFNADHGTDIVSLAGVHIEPLGVYSSRLESIDEVDAGARVSIPNDATNGGRALLLLQEAGLIEVDPDAGIVPSVFDITANPLNLRFFELEAAQLARSLEDVEIAVINGNYALEANLVPTQDSIFLEGAESPYVNILAVRAEDTEDPALLALAAALNSDAVRDFITTRYPDSVVPTF